MAVNSLSISSNCSILNLHPFRTSRLIFPASIPYSRHHSRSLALVSEMQQSFSESSQTSQQDHRPMISSADNSIIAQTTTTTTTTSTGQNVQILSLASNLPPWATLVLGSMLLLAIPFCRKCIRLLDVTKKVESAAEVVEMVAETTEKVAEELIHVLPNGWLKEAAVELEKIAFFVDKGAEVTESIIDKVDDVVEVLDTTLKPVLNGDQIKLDGDGEGVTEKIGMPTKISATAELKE
ncbi:hypothetical protein KSP39_PZI010263 [Platanthera zijinensis]|uniref:Uncharacterized protein n=1 Tax=Platanthera zijinensis TaxID=2320716 RepID=A0AAP0BHX5_9ASPA